MATRKWVKPPSGSSSSAECFHYNLWSAWSPFSIHIDILLSLCSHGISEAGDALFATHRTLEDWSKVVNQGSSAGRLTVMDLVSIFLIIAIAADNILLLYNTYELAPAVMPSTSQSPGEKMRHNPLELTVEKSLSSTGDISIFFQVSGLF